MITKNKKQLPQYVFLFILDAVRKDHVSLYGYQRKTTPNIDKLAKQADVYTLAFAPAPYTLASVPSILAGKYPIELSNSFTGGEFDWEDFETLRLLKEKGYMTAMFTANIVTSSLKTNLDQFFDYFWDNLTEEELNRPAWLYQKADVVLAAVKEFVKKHKKEKLFVVIHLMEAHGPYVPQIESVFKGDKVYNQDKRVIDRLVPTTFRGVTEKVLAKYKTMPRYQALMKGDDYERQVAEYIAKYDMGIYLLDKQVGKFLGFLEKSRLYDNSQLIITSDHGELMGEENIFFAHGVLAHPVLALVPLVVKNAGQRKSSFIKNKVSLTDLMGGIIKGRDKVVNREMVINIHPKSLGIGWQDRYVVFHNGEFSDVEKEGESILPLARWGAERMVKEMKGLKIDVWVRSYKQEGVGYKLVEDGKEKELIESLLFVVRALFFQLDRRFKKPKRSERLAIRMLVSSLMAENQFQRLWEYIRYKLKF